MVRPIPKDIIVPFLIEEERCVLRVYDDKQPKKVLKPGDTILGVLTAGVGHTGSDLKIGTKVTQEMADDWLMSDLMNKAAKPLAAKIGDVIDELTQHQYAALLSFVFNLGTGDPKKREWTIWSRVRNHDFDQVPLEIMKFTNWNGQKSEGLVRRRTAEIRLWSVDEPGSIAETPSSTTTRAEATPPTPSDPVPPSKSGTIIGAAVAATAAVPGAVKEISNAVSPYADKSETVQRIVAILATVGAVAAIVVLVFAWLAKKKARH